MNVRFLSYSWIYLLNELLSGSKSSDTLVVAVSMFGGALLVLNKTVMLTGGRNIPKKA